VTRDAVGPWVELAPAVDQDGRSRSLAERMALAEAQLEAFGVEALQELEKALDEDGTFTTTERATAFLVAAVRINRHLETLLESITATILSEAGVESSATIH
jgi:hypothetical protein